MGEGNITTGRPGAYVGGGRRLPPVPASRVGDVRLSPHSALMQWVADEATYRGCSAHTVIADALEHYRDNTMWPAGPDD